MRAVLKALKWMLLALLALVLAWLAFNNPLADSAERARPAALIEQPNRLPKASNAYEALNQLAEYRSGQSGAARISGAPWQCGTQPEDCTEVWIAQAPALRAQMTQAAEFGRRCEAVAASGLAFEEPILQLQAGNAAGTPVSAHYLVASDCLRWLRASASLALVDHDPARALRLLTQADRLTRALLAGSRTLVSHAVAWVNAKRNWQAMVALQLHEPGMAPSLQALLGPLDPAAQTAQRWMAAESRISTTLVRELKNGCHRDPPGEGWSLSDRAWCWAGIGMLPNKTVQQIDAHWLRALEATQAAGLGGSLSVPPLRPGSDVAPTYAWRNTIGQILVSVAQPSYADYVARQADVELHRQAALLALQMNVERVPAERRFDWLQSHLSDFPLLTTRVRIEGEQLYADSWRSDLGHKLEPRDLILLPLAKR